MVKITHHRSGSFGTSVLSWAVGCLKGVVSLVWTTLPRRGYFHTMAAHGGKVVRVHYVSCEIQGHQAKREVFRFTVL